MDSMPFVTYGDTSYNYGPALSDADFAKYMDINFPESQGASSSVPQSTSLPGLPNASEIVGEPFGAEAGPDLIPFTGEQDGIVIEDPQALDIPAPDLDRLSDSCSYLVFAHPDYLASLTASHVNPIGNAGAGAGLDIPPAHQVHTSTEVLLEHATEYPPTPESFANSPAVHCYSTVGYNFDEVPAEAARLVTHGGPYPQDAGVWDQQVPTTGEPSPYQPHPHHDPFVPSFSQVQPAHNAQLPSSDFQFTFRAPVPAPSFTLDHSATIATMLPPPTNPVDASSALAYPSPALSTVSEPSPLVRSKSTLGPQPRKSERSTGKGLLKRALNTASARSSGSRGSRKRQKGSTSDRHPSIPQGDWEQELDRLRLNEERKYFYNSVYPRSHLEIKGDAVIKYACLYFDPHHETPCWAKLCWGQPTEWLLEVSNGSRQKAGFFPRHEAEMLRHLAEHREADVRVARRRPELAPRASVWQDKLIDDQIIKDRDDPDNQIWYPDEKRKSREELSDLLSFSSFDQN